MPVICMILSLDRGETVKIRVKSNKLRRNIGKVDFLVDPDLVDKMDHLSFSQDVSNTRYSGFSMTARRGSIMHPNNTNIYPSCHSYSSNGLTLVSCLKRKPLWCHLWVSIQTLEIH